MSTIVFRGIDDKLWAVKIKLFQPIGKVVENIFYKKWISILVRKY